MTTTFERKPKCRAVVRAEIPAEEAETLRREVLSEFTKNVKVPGFRKGKAPRRILEQRFSRQVAREMESKLVNRIVDKLGEEAELAVMQPLKVSESQAHPDGSWSMAIEVLTAPSFELPNYTGIPIRVPRVAVEEADVDQVLEKERRNHADYGDEPAGTPLAPGQFAVIDFEGFLDGAPLASRLPPEGGYFAKRVDAWLKIEEGSFLPGFYEALVGHCMGETVQVQSVIPEDFAIEELRGRQVDYTVAIKGVKTERLPTLESLGGGSEEGLSALREHIKQHLFLEQTKARARASDAAVLDYLHRALDFELPPEIVHSYAQRSVNDLVRQNQDRGIPDEVIREQESVLVEAAGNRARGELKTEFILLAIAKKQGIELTKDEFREAVIEIADSAGLSYSKTLDRLARNRRLGEVGTKRLFRKVLDFLIDESNIVEE